jgi:hypothetical protein
MSDMIFVSDLTWWLLLIIAFILTAALAYREAFRFQLLIGPHGKTITFLAFFAILVWFAVISGMAFHSGLWSALVGFLLSFVAGIVILNIIKTHYVNWAQAIVAEGDWENRVTDIVIGKSLNSEDIQLVMHRYSITETVRPIWEKT